MKRFWFNLFHLDYVEELRTLVFTMPEGDLKAVSARYSALAPQPLNTQFPERRGKEEAIKLHTERKKTLVTELYPAGKSPVVL